MGRRLLTAIVILVAVLLHARPASAAATTLTGFVTDSRTGQPAPGIIVAVAPYVDGFDEAMAGDAPPSVGDVTIATTADDGSYSLTLDTSAPMLAVDVYGAARGYVTYHGVFANGAASLPTIALTFPTLAEEHALAQINAFRRAPGGERSFGAAQPLIFDQNLVLSARYWAGEEKRARRIGHTCEQLGRPAGCVEFRAFFHSLPGALPNDDPGQNAALDSDPSWSDPDRLFEIEGASCGYDWHACTGDHYVNLMSAQHWIGFGEAIADGYGAFFAQNLL